MEVGVLCYFVVCWLEAGRVCVDRAEGDGEEEEETMEEQKEREEVKYILGVNCIKISGQCIGALAVNNRQCL